MSIENEIKKLTAAVVDLTAILYTSRNGGETVQEAAPAKTEEKKPEAAKKPASPPPPPPPAPEPETKTEPQADAPSAEDNAKALDEIVAVIRAHVGKYENGSDEQAVEAAKIRTVLSEAGAAKAGDVAPEKAVEVLARLKAIASGEAVGGAAEALV